MVKYAKAVPPTCTVFPVSQQFVSSITFTLDPFGTQEINVAIEEALSKQTVLGFLITRLRTSTVVIAAELGILCYRCKTKRGSTVSLLFLFLLLQFIFLIFPPFKNVILVFKVNIKSMQIISLNLHASITVSGIVFHQNGRFARCSHQLKQLILLILSTRQ